MKILLIGCTGLVGTKLFEKLSQKHEVIGFCRSKPRNCPKGAIYYNGDVSEASILYDIIRRHRPDVVIHNAAVSHPMLFLDQPFRIVNVNVNGTMNALEASRQFDVKRFVYISSGAVYGECHLDVVPEETMRYAQSIYGASKIACEELVRTYNVPSLSLRVGFVYGPGRELYCPIRSLLVDLLEKNEAVWAKGIDQMLDYIHVDDVADCIMAAAEAPETHYGEYNVGSGKMVSFGQIVEIARQIFPLANIQIGPGTLGFDALGAMSIQRAKEDFGWQPKITLAEGMKNYITYLKETRC